MRPAQAGTDLNMSFEKAYAQTAKHEGGYAHDPADAGGETFRGISRKMHPGWPGWPAVDLAKASARVAGCGEPKRLAEYVNRWFLCDVQMDALVEEFYRAEFWERLEKKRGKA